MMRPTAYFGINIGGTRTTITSSGLSDAPIAKRTIDIPTIEPEGTLRQATELIEKWEPGDSPVIGVACGNPLDVSKGLITCPPNLPGWDKVPVVEMLQNTFGGQTYLMNDANAGALAEWWFGAGRRCQHMAFITAGTGFGAGLILNGKLYEGVLGNAGEIGHLRLENDGPIGYGKAGSVEGFCSGGGIAQMGQAVATEYGGDVAFNPGPIEKITALHIGKAAEKGDPHAKEVLALAGRQMGKAIAILIDLLNPEVIVLGSIYARCRPFLEPEMRKILAEEALEDSLHACDIRPAKLGEDLSAYAALSIGHYHQGRFEEETG
ncbi:MAG: ROK family protein [Verrucomicrobiota bacterium]